MSDKALTLDEAKKVLSDVVCNEIDTWVAKYPENHSESAVLAALSATQEHHEGWVTEEHMNAIATYLNMPKISVYENASFYSMIELAPVGKYILNVCTNISCCLNNSDKVVSHLEQKLNIKCGQTTEDGKFTLRSVECLAACVSAPVMQVKDKYYEKLTPEKIDGILETLS